MGPILVNKLEATDSGHFKMISKVREVPNSGAKSSCSSSYSHIASSAAFRKEAR